jgi:hypothetical protein
MKDALASKQRLNLAIADTASDTKSMGLTPIKHGPTYFAATHIRFSNRPVGVKRFQTILPHSVDVARGVVLLYGIGTQALPSWDSRMRWNNLYRGLADCRQVQADMRTHLIHRPARDIIPPLGGARVFPPIAFDPARLSRCCSFLSGPAELGAVNPDAVHDHRQSSR